MSAVLSTVGKVAGVVATIAPFFGPVGMTVSAVASAVALVANVGTAITARKPPARGSVNGITIGSEQPMPWLIGETYYGGSRIYQNGYGPTIDKVPNPYALIVDVYSGAGPVEGLLDSLADFASLGVPTTGGSASGYAGGFLWAARQLGNLPEPALVPHFAGAPGWGGGYALSGYAAIAWSLLFDRKGNVFASGVPQLGAVWRGQKMWDPRADSSYVGGSGAHRWAAPSDTAAHDVARASWTYSTCPGLNALKYALGAWHRDPRVPGSTYHKVAGIGLPVSGIIVEDFVHLANICDANGWKAGGVVFDPATGSASTRWQNLKDILAAGGAEPCFRGGRLGLKLSAPRIALDTITAVDLADDETVVASGVGWEERLNTLVPKYRSRDHKWEYVASTTPVSIAAQVAVDGEVKRAERQYNLVQDKDQAAQLCAYELIDRREIGEIELVVKPRLRRYGPGDLVIVDLPDEGLAQMPCVILKRQPLPDRMAWKFTLMSETPGKHAFALGRTAVAPPIPMLRTTADLDGVAAPVESATVLQLAIKNSWVVEISAGINVVAAAAEGTVTIANHTRRYADRDVAVQGGTIATAFAAGTIVSIGYDDPDRTGGAVTFHAYEDENDAFNSSTNPARHYVQYVVIPESGTSTGGGGGAGGGREGACVVDDTPVLMANAARTSAGETKPASAIAVTDWIWTQHEVTRAWGAYQVTDISFHDADVWAADGPPHATADHQFDRDGWWTKAKALGEPAGRARVAKITVEGARTYVTVQSDGARVLNHNIKNTQPDV